MAKNRKLPKRQHRQLTNDQQTNDQPWLDPDGFTIESFLLPPLSGPAHERDTAHYRLGAKSDKWYTVNIGFIPPNQRDLLKLRFMHDKRSPLTPALIDKAYEVRVQGVISLDVVAAMVRLDPRNFHKLIDVGRRFGEALIEDKIPENPNQLLYYALHFYMQHAELLRKGHAEKNVLSRSTHGTQFKDADWLRRRYKSEWGTQPDTGRSDLPMLPDHSYA